MMLVYAPGCWDLLHVGHVSFLQRARALGDRLIVGVPCDDVVMQDKGCLPIVPVHDRVLMLQSLRCVDVAVPYRKLEFLTHLEMFKPDLLAIGETWGTETRHLDAEVWMREHGGRVVRLPYSPGVSTTKLRRNLQ